MDITLLTVGKTTKQFIQSGIEEYCGRLKCYIGFSVQIVPDVKATKNTTEISQKEKEGEMLLSNISPSDFCILLDEHGKEYTSMEFSHFLQKIMASGRKRAVFLIGGPYGFSDEVRKRADSKISLSKLTFTHEMARLFFVEQIYRAMTIIRGEPYHHE